ncbi:hypothetical protein OBBRIDRAFT_852543 [Obba rivulosa]|uniref:Uncharacterized protein n=1 Tax=Obba rivulosa TaxID=1052685 RepID=A0A8E2DHA1_9APHY|nr:hypothetical protein OBBRIDRAFT_852543 [Obba rivulosa]
MVGLLENIASSANLLGRQNRHYQRGWQLTEQEKSVLPTSSREHYNNGHAEDNIMAGHPLLTASSLRQARGASTRVEELPRWAENDWILRIRFKRGSLSADVGIADLKSQERNGISRLAISFEASPHNGIIGVELESDNGICKSKTGGIVFRAANINLSMHAY